MNVVPAGVYTSQVWGTDSLGVECTTSNWAVLKGCGHQSLQSYGFRAVVKLYNSMLGTNSITLRRVMHADLKLQLKDDKRWTAQLIQAFQDLRYSMQGVWKEIRLVDSRGNNDKLATYQAWFATPFVCNARQTYVPLPWCLFLDLPKQPQSDQPNNLAEGQPPS
eukprot:1161117-Pelagomonas_calceolata.AAC.3